MAAIADTIGAARSSDVAAVLDGAVAHVPADRLALHFHDTHGRALATMATGLAHGIATFDSTPGSLGGCPFAPGAPGNLGTEALVAFLARHGIETDVDGAAVARAVAALRAGIGDAVVS